MDTKKGQPVDPKEARREEAKKLDPQVRTAAVQLLPPSMNQMGAKIEKQVAVVEQLLSYDPKTADEALKKKLILDEEAKKLASLVGSAKQQEQQRQDPLLGKVQLTATQQNTQNQVLRDRITAIDKELSSLIPMAKKQPAIVPRVIALQKERDVIVSRLALVAQGLDLDKPLKLEAATMPEQRKPLPLPPVSVPPQDSEVLIITNLLAKAVPRLQSESQKAYEAKLSALTARVLARLARMSAIAGKDRGEAIKVAVEETLFEDTQVIQKEIAATGAVAKDPAADAMEIYIDAVPGVVQAAAATKAPEVPGALPSNQDIAQLLTIAEAQIFTCGAAPKELSDEIAEDIQLADVPVNESKIPWLWIGVGALGLITLRKLSKR